MEIDISQNQKDDIISSLILISKKEDVIDISRAISIFISKADLSKNELWDLVNDIIKNSDNLNDENVLKNYINELKKYNIDIDKIFESDNYLNILLVLEKNPDSISFLIGKTEQDCRNLQEAAVDNDNGLLNVNNIKDFEECVKFINKFGDEGNLKQMDSVKFFNSLQSEVKKNKDIIFYFSKYINDYEELKNLYETKFDKSAASKRIIIAIGEEAIFTLKNENKIFSEEIIKSKLRKKES